MFQSTRLVRDATELAEVFATALFKSMFLRTWMKVDEQFLSKAIHLPQTLKPVRLSDFANLAAFLCALGVRIKPATDPPYQA